MLFSTSPCDLLFHALSRLSSCSPGDDRALAFLTMSRTDFLLDPDHIEIAFEGLGAERFLTLRSVGGELHCPVAVDRWFATHFVEFQGAVPEPC